MGKIFGKFCRLSYLSRAGQGLAPLFTRTHVHTHAHSHAHTYIRSMRFDAQFELRASIIVIDLHNWMAGEDAHKSKAHTHTHTPWVRETHAYTRTAKPNTCASIIESCRHRCASTEKQKNNRILQPKNSQVGKRGAEVADADRVTHWSFIV